MDCSTYIKTNGGIQPANISSEIWVDIPGHEGDYQLSSLGRVRSFLFQGTSKQRRVTPHILQPFYQGAGYAYVSLRKDNDTAIHHLVALIFIGPRPDQHVVRHLDGDRRNNAVSNIAYGTRSQNMIDRGPCKRLSLRKVRSIKKRVGEDRPGDSLLKLARTFNTSPQTIAAIKYGRRHASVEVSA